MASSFFDDFGGVVDAQRVAHIRRLIIEVRSIEPNFLAGPFWLLSFTNRSGSNWLSELLEERFRIISIGESLNEPSLSAIASTLDGAKSSKARHLPSEVERHLIGEPTLVKSNLEQLVAVLGLAAGGHVSHPKGIISAFRSSPVNQILSFRRASATKSWASFMADKQPVPATIDWDQLGAQSKHMAIRNWATSWVSEASGLPWASVSYEDLVEMRNEVLELVGKKMNLRSRNEAPPIKRKFEAQADLWNQQMKAKVSQITLTSPLFIPTSGDSGAPSNLRGAL